jgi:hypothetical protein
MRVTILMLLAVPAVARAAPAEKAAPAKTVQPFAKAPAACGAKILPLAVGNEWTYTPITAPNPIDSHLAKYAPIEPKRIVITVKSVAPDKQTGETVATLEETSVIEVKDAKDSKKITEDARTVTTTITCNAHKFDIDPNSFFFAGEPGASVAIALDHVDRKGTSWALTNGTIGENAWQETLNAHWTSTPFADSQAKPLAGTVTIERTFTPQPDEKIGTPLGVYNTNKVGLQIAGRVAIDGDPKDQKPLEMPDNWINTLWIADNVGVVQVLNKYAHEYQLSDAKLK